jgi:hypothetical protein
MAAPLAVLKLSTKVKNVIATSQNIATALTNNPSFPSLRVAGDGDRAATSGEKVAWIGETTARSDERSPRSGETTATSNEMSSSNAETTAWSGERSARCGLAFGPCDETSSSNAEPSCWCAETVLSVYQDVVPACGDVVFEQRHVVSECREA